MSAGTRVELRGTVLYPALMSLITYWEALIFSSAADKLRLLLGLLTNRDRDSHCPLLSLQPSCNYGASLIFFSLILCSSLILSCLINISITRNVMGNMLVTSLSQLSFLKCYLAFYTNVFKQERKLWANANWILMQNCYQIAVLFSRCSSANSSWLCMTSGFLKMINCRGLFAENITSSLKINVLVKIVITLTRDHSSKCRGGVAALPSGGNVRWVSW